MKKYIVTGGTAYIGQGEVVGLTADQFRPRATSVEVIEKLADGGAIVRANSVLQFKAGEEIGLAAAPSKAMAEILLSPEDATAAQAAADADAEAQAKLAADAARKTAHSKPARRRR